MKINKLYIVYFLLIMGVQCKAQSPIIDLNEVEPTTTNFYIKDIHNVLDPFVGTWVLNDGVNYLKIVFQKKTLQYLGNRYEDVLIGEYQYKQNGVELVNTLNMLTQTFPNYTYHSIDGNYFKTNHTPFDDYTTDNFRLCLIMKIPGGITADLDIRKAIVNGQEAIQIFKRTNYWNKKGEVIPPIIVPNGFFYLIKQ